MRPLTKQHPSRRIFMAGLFAASLFVVPTAGPALADQHEPAASLEELLKRVQSNWRKEQKTNKQREQEFKAAKQDQAQKLSDAKADRAAEEKKSDDLERQFEENELELAELEELLASRLGNLGELFGVVRQVAGDTRGQIEASLISSQHPGREVFLGELGQSRSLPDIEDLEGLYATLLEEMIESGKVTRYRTPVVAVDGQESEKEVIRIGAFNVISEGRYLIWSAETGKLVELGRQPAAKYLRTAKALDGSTGGVVPVALDPARGAILEVLIETPSFEERIAFGGTVGYAIIVLGVITFLVGLARLAVLMFVNMRVRAQRRSPDKPGNNPLGRVLAVYNDNRNIDTETLELKLEEKILHESTKLERLLWLVKVVSAVAPLMGLLGTVTGMIRTFQIITLFGTGDPKLMAGGISEALVTTMLGLFTAIPLVLLHSWLASMSKSIIAILEEQGTGMVAAQAEEAGSSDANQ